MYINNAYENLQKAMQFVDGVAIVAVLFNVSFLFDNTYTFFLSVLFSLYVF